MSVDSAQKKPTASGALPDVIRRDLDEICGHAKVALERLAGKTVLVAGGEGFLPSYLADALLHANDRGLSPRCRVICVDNRSTADSARLAHRAGRDDFVLVEQDVTLPLELDEPVDYVVHGASIASPTWYRERPLETIDVNVDGTRRLLDLALRKGVTGFLYLSSSEIYGDPPPERVPTTEDYWGHVSSVGPRACYDESKRLAETLCMTYHRLHGLADHDRAALQRLRTSAPAGRRQGRARLCPGRPRRAPHLRSSATAGSRAASATSRTLSPRCCSC